VLRKLSIPLAFLALVGSSACSSPPAGADACAVGSEGCACTPGGGCDAELRCLSQLCVAATASKSGQTDGGAAGQTQETSPHADGGQRSEPNTGPTEAGAAGAEAAGAASGGSASEPAICPLDMVEIPGRRLCVDRYEASRSDASSEDAGTAGGPAHSVRDVQPWVRIGQAAAEAACGAADKRLCTADEWQSACRGANAQQYPYGPEYDANACLTGDTDYGGSVPAATAAFPTCEGGYPGLFDLVGNVAEWTSTQTQATCATCFLTKGGKYNSTATTNGGVDCLSSLEVAQTVMGLSLGFRCCKGL
jgi:formylglycine-generating enzyme required for sulfatase activity